ncbi:MAG: PQQ-like beta-propeller repeat protein, partial [Planctomycetota bacterium]|nr:PQQ-like beta-propeller repeat protein [Planctomycetota bacterium]
NARRLIGAVLCGVILVGATCAMAQDWPQWRGVNRDGKVAGFTAPAAWPKELAQKWKATVGTGDATPALVGDKLYVFARQADDEVTLCLDAATGKELWKDKYAATAVQGAAARHPGPRSSPTVADGKVVTLGVGGVLSCLDAATGKVAWRNEEFKAVPMFFTAMSPIVVDGMVIAHLGGKGAGTLAALDLASGAAKWKWTGDGPAYGSPVLMTAEGAKMVVVQTEKSLVGVAVADGKMLWQVATPPVGRFFNSATPILDGQTVIVTGHGSGTKAVKIEKSGDAFAAKELWANAELGTGFDTPVLKDGFLYGFSDKGSLYCMDAKTGKVCWTDATKRGQGNFAAVLDAGAALFALPSNSELVVVKPSDKEFTELAKYKVSETPTYATPVVAGKRIFVKDQDTVVMWTME